MLTERIEHIWIEAFSATFALCGVKSGDVCVILSETQSRPINVHLAELALLRLGARICHLILPTPAVDTPAPVRSTGASHALRGHSASMAALTSGVFIADLTVEGLLHAPELGRILKSGSRVLMISNEHPEALQRLVPEEALAPKVKAGVKRLSSARFMTVSSQAGTDLKVDLQGAAKAGVWGWCDKPGQVAHWPGGLCIAFPAEGTVTGRVVLAAGDVNLTFKRYLENQVHLIIENDFITKIEGDNLDAHLTRSYFSAWGDKEAYAISHVGWGMNRKARWDSLAMYDKRDTNGTELRAFAGNFLFSTGANEFAKRFTKGHFDIPMRSCTIRLDGDTVVSEGNLIAELC